MDITTLIIAGITILGFTTGTIEFIKLKKLLRTGVRVKGRKIGYTTILDDDNIEIELPILEFLDKKGRTIKSKLDENSFNKKKTIDIIYDPENPTKIISNYWTNNIPWVFLMSTGTVSLILLIVKLASR